jgi:hypothetical protein
MEFVRRRIQHRYQDRPYSSAQPPFEIRTVQKCALEEEPKNRVFGQMSGFAKQKVQPFKGGGGDSDVEKGQYFGEKPGRGRAAVAFG